jgi:hypothetical protein
MRMRSDAFGLGAAIPDALGACAVRPGLGADRCNCGIFQSFPRKTRPAQDVCGRSGRPRRFCGDWQG